MAKVEKINIASLKVLNTLLCLFKKDLSMKELIAELNSGGTTNYNNFVISKYINTCRSCGIDIQKINNKYTIINFPIGMKFNAKESKLLYEIKLLSENLKPDSIEENIRSLFNKLHLNFFKSNNGLPSSKNYKVIKMFEKACLSKTRILIIFKNFESYKCSPKSIRVVDGKIFFNTYNNMMTKEINPDDVIDIKLTDEKTEVSFMPTTVLFELYGRLAQNYQMRENEQLHGTKHNNNTLVISNKFEDKDELLHRLMRYGSLCKIIRPKNYALEMKEMIEKSLENYN